MNNSIEELSELIRFQIDNLEGMKTKLKERSHRKAQAIANYDKSLALTIIEIRNGKGVTVDGKLITDTGVSLADKLAKGACYQQRLEMEVAEAEYKSLIAAIEVTKAQLNGLQSINRHLDTI